MGDKVFINGMAAVHAGSSAQGTAMPDVCLCPPSPPAGPVRWMSGDALVLVDLCLGRDVKCACRCDAQPGKNSQPLGSCERRSTDHQYSNRGQRRQKARVDSARETSCAELACEPAFVCAWKRLSMGLAAPISGATPKRFFRSFAIDGMWR